jgi:hypothetical protein
MVHHSDGPYGHRTIQLGDGALNAHPLPKSDLPGIRYDEQVYDQITAAKRHFTQAQLQGARALVLAAYRRLCGRSSQSDAPWRSQGSSGRRLSTPMRLRRAISIAKEAADKTSANHTLSATICQRNSILSSPSSLGISSPAAQLAMSKKMQRLSTMGRISDWFVIRTSISPPGQRIQRTFQEH